MPIAGRGIKCTRFALRKKAFMLSPLSYSHSSKEVFGLEVDAE